MKIAVVGIGVAGAYLMNRLSDDHDNHVVGFERMPMGLHDAVCAWATCENVMAGFTKKCGLSFDDYILHDGKHMRVDLEDKGRGVDIKLEGMVSYDKLGLIQEMIRGTEIRFGKAPRKDELESDFDIIIDSTGFHRNYLPRVVNEMWIPVCTGTRFTTSLARNHMMISICVHSHRCQGTSGISRLAMATHTSEPVTS